LSGGFVVARRDFRNIGLEYESALDDFGEDEDDFVKVEDEVEFAYVFE
jgi:hypothetical protein